MTIVHRFFIRLDSLLAFAMRFLSIGCMITLLIILSGVVFVRVVPLVSLGWSDAIVEGAFAWLVFIGAAALWRDREHFSVNWLQERQAGKPSGKYIELMVELLSLIFITVMTYYGLKLTIAANDWSPILQLPRRLWYSCIPTAGLPNTSQSTPKKPSKFRRKFPCAKPCWPSYTAWGYIPLAKRPLNPVTGS